jgi:hypothetical protein
MYTDEQIIEEIRRVAEKLGTRSISAAQFNQHAQLSDSTARLHFGSWNAAVEAAGLNPIPAGPQKTPKRIDDDELLLDLIRLYNESGKPPTVAMISAKGRFSPPSYTSRWGNHLKAFEIAKKKFNVLLSENQQSPQSQIPLENSIRVIPRTIGPKSPRTKRTVFGEPIDFRGLRFAPVNEQGVVYLFGMISHEMGFLIESVRTSFPDCEGKRCFDKQKKQWEHITIEFEYKSSHFKDHGHDPDGCHLIVCWIHDWEACPIEVLELRDIIKYL